MEGATLHTLILLPAGLGLLGFIEPCTIGGHLIFLETQASRTGSARVSALITFVIARTFVAGSFGALIAVVGQFMISAQTGLWLMFGLLYGAIGLAVLFGAGSVVKAPIRLSPESWRRARHPVTLGVAFGLNIPACAAPILFGLLAMAASAGTVLSGFWMMAVFGFALSLPLVPILFVPRLATALENLAGKLKQRNWILAIVFLVLGAWSVWFGLFVDPANWSGR